MTVRDGANNAMKGVPVTVPGGATPARFTYTVDLSRLCRAGNVTVTVTGWYLGKSRQLQALLRPSGFLDYAYFSDYEVQDPAGYTSNPFEATGDTIENQCGRHFYEPTRQVPATAPDRPDQSNVPVATSAKCVGVNWGDKDEVKGAVHSNDALLICGTPGGRLLRRRAPGRPAHRNLAGGLPTPETMRRVVRALLVHQQGQLSDDATMLLLEWRSGDEDALLP